MSQSLEDRIQELRLTAPRITPDHINSVIVSKTFTVLPSGKVTVCEITLTNGFTVRGESSVVSKANFNQEIGERVSFENAVKEIWQLEGYLLQENLYQKAVADK